MDGPLEIGLYCTRSATYEYGTTVVATDGLSYPDPLYKCNSLPVLYCTVHC